jgi:MFS family permease
LRASDSLRGRFSCDPWWTWCAIIPALRESAFLGAALLCVFSAFWTTLVFLLQTPPYHFGSSVAGLFGLVGAAGALCAPLVGRFADRRGPRFTILLALLTTLASFLLLGAFGKVMAGLIIGVILLDVGVQSGHVANQTRIYALDANARSRLNTVYMVCYFSGGSLGSWLGAVCWAYKGWMAVCARFGIAGLSRSRWRCSRAAANTARKSACSRTRYLSPTAKSVSKCGAVFLAVHHRRLDVLEPGLAQEARDLHFGEAEPQVGVQLARFFVAVTQQIQHHDPAAGFQDAPRLGHRTLGMLRVMQRLAEEREIHGHRGSALLRDRPCGIRDS